MSSSTSITGTLGGVPISSLISAADAANRSQAVTLQSQVDTINTQSTAVTDLQNDMQTLDTYLTALSDPQFFRSKTASVSDSTVGSGTVDTSLAALGNYDINITQVATATNYTGAKATAVQPGTATVLSVFGASAGGTLTVGTASGGTTNITIDPNSTLNAVAAQLQANIPGSTVTYSGGKFNISANDSLILSSGTSTFLQSAQLYNGSSVRSSGSTSFFSSTDSYLSSTGTQQAETMSGYFGSSFVAGTFTLNGSAVQVNASDTIDDVVNRVNAQIPGVDATVVNGKIAFNSASTVTVGNGTGSFFKQAGLVASSSTSSTSATTVGTRSTTDVIDNVGGSVTVNGVTVTYDAGATLQDVLNNITTSSAGVTATYDDFNDQIVLTSTTPGPGSIQVSGASAGLQAFGLGAAGATTQVGKSTIFTVNGGASRVSSSNVLDSTALGLTGVTFTANKAGDTTLTVGVDVATIMTGINTFVTAYNAVQNEIASDIQINTTNSALDGTLYADSTIVGMPQQMRLLMDGIYSGNSTIKSLLDLGIDGNENDDTVTQVDTTKLGSALTNNLQEVISLFTDANNGIVTTVGNYISAMSLGSGSILGSEVTSKATQVQQLTDQIKQINETADNQKTQLETEYANYEAAYQSAQSTMSYVSGSTSSSSSSSSTSSSGGILG